MYVAGATFCLIVIVATVVWFLMRVAGTSVDKPLYVSRKHARELAEDERWQRWSEMLDEHKGRS